MKAIEMYSELIAKNSKDFGICDYDGVHYTLVQQQAYADYDSRYPDDECYHAHAICGDDEIDENGEVPCYEITWFATAEGKAYLEETGDESAMCDWDAPIDVSRIGSYCIEDNIIW